MGMPGGGADRAEQNVEGCGGVGKGRVVPLETPWTKARVAWRRGGRLSLSVRCVGGGRLGVGCGWVVSLLGWGKKAKDVARRPQRPGGRKRFVPPQDPQRARAAAAKLAQPPAKVPTTTGPRTRAQFLATPFCGVRLLSPLTLWHFPFPPNRLSFLPWFFLHGPGHVKRLGACTPAKPRTMDDDNDTATTHASPQSPDDPMAEDEGGTASPMAPAPPPQEEEQEEEAAAALSPPHSPKRRAKKESVSSIEVLKDQLKVFTSQNTQVRAFLGGWLAFPLPSAHPIHFPTSSCSPPSKAWRRRRTLRGSARSPWRRRNWTCAAGASSSRTRCGP